MTAIDRPMSAEKRARLVQELADNGSTVYPSYATWLREALASDAIRAEQVRRLRVFVAEVPIGCYEHGQDGLSWCVTCSFSSVSEAKRTQLLAATAEAE